MDQVGRKVDAPPDFLLRLLADNTETVIFAYDMGRRLLYVNPALQQQTGYSLEEMHERHFIDRVHPEDRARMTALWERLYQGEGYSGVEFRIIAKTGVVKWLLGSWGPILDEHGKQIGIQGREIDITDRKEAEERLRMSEMRLAKAQEIAHLGIWEQDLVTDGLYWSEETYQIFGIPTAVPITTELFFKCVAPEDLDPLRKALRKAIEEKSAYAMDHRIVRPDGTERYVHEQAEIVYDQDGKSRRLIGTVQDITQSRRLQEQLRQAQKMEAIGLLAGGVAHDFNNLLTAVIGHSELLLHKLNQNHPLRPEIEEIKKAGERAAQLTRQLLAFSRKQVLQPVVLDLNSLVESMSKMLRRLIREDIHLVTVPYPGLWSVKTDPGQMQQVILNLVLNARDAMPRGGMLTIGLGNVELDETHQHHQITMKPGRYVVLAVSDSGEGMDSATQARIFEPFFTTKAQGKGTGLGLSTVYGIIKQSGGYIWVDSEPRKGATFEIYLPRAEEAVAPETQAADAPQSGPGSKTILLVEDDTSVRSPIRRMLERGGYRVLEAGEAEEAMRVAIQHNAALDLMLTDVVMPRMSGRQLAERMSILYPKMKVLYMSGYADDTLVREAAAETGRDFIEKPFTGIALVRKVREVLGDSGSDTV